MSKHLIIIATLMLVGALLSMPASATTACGIVKTANQNIPNNQIKAVAFESVETDSPCTASMPARNSLRIAEPGTYLLWSNMAWEGSNTAGERAADFWITPAGISPTVVMPSGTQDALAASGGDSQMTISYITALQADDIVRVAAWQSSGAPLALTSARLRAIKLNNAAQETLRLRSNQPQSIPGDSVWTPVDFQFETSDALNLHSIEPAQDEYISTPTSANDGWYLVYGRAQWADDANTATRQRFMRFQRVLRTTPPALDPTFTLDRNETPDKDSMATLFFLSLDASDDPNGDFDKLSLAVKQSDDGAVDLAFAEFTMVRSPFQSARCSLKDETAVTVPASQPWAVNFIADTEDRVEYSDPQDMHADTGGSIVTVPTAGWYLVAGHIGWSNPSGPSSGDRMIAFSVNGAVQAPLVEPTSDGQSFHNNSMLRYLNAGAHVELVVATAQELSIESASLKLIKVGDDI